MSVIWTILSKYIFSSIFYICCDVILHKVKAKLSNGLISAGLMFINLSRNHCSKFIFKSYHAKHAWSIECYDFLISNISGMNQWIILISKSMQMGLEDKNWKLLFCGWTWILDAKNNSEFRLVGLLENSIVIFRWKRMVN